jgi:hypothetical protein
MTTPDHLKPIEPASAVHELCARLATEIPANAYGVVAEFNAFMETRTPHDGRRLANALRHVLKRPDLADQVEALLPLPEAAVAEVVAIIIGNIPHMPSTLGSALKAFAESRTVHDARRLATALRHDHGQAGLAAEVEDLLPPVREGRARRPG